MLEVLAIVGIVFGIGIGIVFLEAFFRTLCNWCGISAVSKYPHRVGTEQPRVLKKP